jgi:predicted methyltransferase
VVADPLNGAKEETSMSLRTASIACAAVLLLSGATAQAAPAYVAAAVADSGRPPADVARDAERKPAEMIEFAGIKPGMTVIELLPGSGYFTRLFAKAVGPKGVVYALYPPPKPSADSAKPALTPAVLAIAADPAYANVKAIQQPLTALDAPAKGDVFWTSLNYHDLHNVAGLDMAAFNKAVFQALKPGGVYVVVDHVGAPGDPEITHTLHRIDPAVVRREVEAAGFRFEAESQAVRNRADDHSLKVFDPAIRGHTDQFAFRFRKPG